MKTARLHPADRHHDCQEAMNDRLFALMNEATEAGWSESEVALAVYELARAWRRWRYEKCATEAQIGTARRVCRPRACQAHPQMQTPHRSGLTYSGPASRQGDPASGA